MTVVIETRRLFLRRQNASDAPFILRLLNDADFLRFIGDRGVRTLEDAESYIRDGAVASYAANGFGLYLVESKDGGEEVGVCGLLSRDFLEDVDLGFAFLPEHRRRGYAREAAEATIVFACEELGLERLTAIVSPGNTASIRLLEGLGFRSRGPVEHPDGDDVHLYTRELNPQ
ncbi:MAG TPA: GNAT family N-acetyltransferase [Gemmatimonadota bacterium]|nr:GNAT family N-acetyltransferase [Gemmatimonadota bacterium]